MRLPSFRSSFHSFTSIHYIHRLYLIKYLKCIAKFEETQRFASEIRNLQKTIFANIFVQAVLYRTHFRRLEKELFTYHLI